MTEFLKTLLLLSASGSVLGLVLMLARRLCGRRLPSTLWYCAWLPVLLRLVLPLPGLIPQAQPAENQDDPALNAIDDIDWDDDGTLPPHPGEDPRQLSLF